MGPAVCRGRPPPAYTCRRPSLWPAWGSLEVGVRFPHRLAPARWRDVDGLRVEVGPRCLRLARTAVGSASSPVCVGAESPCRAGPRLASAPSPATRGPLAGRSAGAVRSGPGDSPPSRRADAERVSPGGRPWGLARPDPPADSGWKPCRVRGPAVASRWTRQLGSDYCLESGRLEDALTTLFLALAGKHLPALASAALQHAVARGQPSGRSDGVRAPWAGPPFRLARATRRRCIERSFFPAYLGRDVPGPLWPSKPFGAHADDPCGAGRVRCGWLSV